MLFVCTSSSFVGLPSAFSAALSPANADNHDKDSACCRRLARASLATAPSVALAAAARVRALAHTNVTEPGRAKECRFQQRTERRQQQQVAATESSPPTSGICRDGILTRHTATTTAYAARSFTSSSFINGLAPVEPETPHPIINRQPTTLLSALTTSSASTRSSFKRQGGRGFLINQHLSLFAIINLLVIIINCRYLPAPLIVQAYNLDISSIVPNSSSRLSDELFVDRSNIGLKQQQQQIINSPEPAQLSSESEKSITTRGLEFMTNIFANLKFKSHTDQEPAATTPISKNHTTQSLPITTTKTTTIFEGEADETRIEEEENERASSQDDDDDAEGCKGISAHESAKGKNLSDTERLVNLQSCIKGKVKRRLLGAARSGMEIFDKLSLSGGCAWSLMNLMSNLAEIKSFAFKFIDASAKVPSGVMYGLLSDFGDFDQCLSARSNPNVPLELEAEEGAYSGKYCLMSVKLNFHIHLAPNQTVPDGIMPDSVLWDDLLRHYWTSNTSKGFQVGMCFPSRCTNDDLDQIYRHVAESFNVLGEIISCQDNLDLKRQYEPDVVQLIIIYTFYALIIVTVLGTLVDRYYPELAVEQPIPMDVDCQQKLTFCSSTAALAFKILICFSIAKNWNTFICREHIRPMRWGGYLTSRTSCSEGGGSDKTNKTATERMSISSGTLEHIDPNFVIPIEERGIGTPLSVDSKLCQLTVKIQPDYYVPEQDKSFCLSHLSGLRLLVIFWITIGHSFLYPSANNYQHYRSIINMKITRNSVWFATTNFTLGIDMLLYITGLVFVYKLAKLGPKQYQKTESHDYIWGTQANGTGILRLISKKILRFWPTYVTVIAFAIVVPLFSDGPMWPEMVSRRIGGSCRQNWWSNLLFFNNFLAESEICLPSSWFVSVSMQLFLIGSVIVVLERRFSFSVAAVALSLMLLASCIHSFLYAYFFDLRAPVIRMDETFVLDVDENIWRLYINIFNNLGPFLIGMAGGYLLLSTQAGKETPQLKRRSLNSDHKSEPKKTKSRQLIYDILIGLLVACIAILVLSSVFHKEYTKLGSSIYWSFHRIGWAIVTGYIVHNCATGRWQLLNDLLSLSTLIPLSRLVFIAYLVYPIYIHLHSGAVRDGLHVSIYNMFNIYTTRLVLTFTTAMFIHLLIELPFCSIEEIYLNRWILKIENKTKRKSSSKFHPLLAVAPIVQIGNSDFKKVENDQTLSNKKVNLNPQIQNGNSIGREHLALNI